MLTIRFQLFGNDAVHRIRLNPRCGHREQGRIIKQIGLNGIAETYVYLDWYSDVLKVSEEFDTDALILLLLPDLLGDCRFCRKYDAILGHLNVAEFSEHREAPVRVKDLPAPADRDLSLVDAVRRPRPERASLPSEQSGRGTLID